MVENDEDNDMFAFDKRLFLLFSALAFTQVTTWYKDLLFSIFSF